MMIYFLPFVFAFLISVALLPLLYRAFFKKRRAVRFGGAVLILIFLLALFLDKNLVIDRAWWGVIFGSLVVLIYGLWDDIKDLKPGWQLLFQILVILILIGAGVRIDYITNPLGGVLRLDQAQFSIFNFSRFGLDPAVAGQFSIFSSLFILIWLIIIMNAVNWLDGIDGVAGGVSLVGFIVIFFLSISRFVNQPPIGIAAAILAGAVLGFLIFNFPRRGGAKIMLGTSGSIFLGFMLGALSISSGSKIATALLVLSIPVLDAGWVIWHRWRRGESVFRGDKTHLHHRLIKAGVSVPKITLGLIFFSAVIGAVSLFLRTAGKMLAMVLLITVVLAFFGWLERRRRD